MFTHLHVHTKYSLADSSLWAKHLAKRVKEMGMNSVAITDHGNLFGVVEFYKACVKEGVKPIIGMEAYVAPGINTVKEGKQKDSNFHLILLAETNQGYSNLMQISTDAALEGFYYKARTDKFKLREYHEGLIASSACLGGEVQSLILDDNYEAAKRVALEYQDIFGEGNFYLELQNHGMEDQEKCNRALIRMNNETNIPLIATNDCHYLDKEDAVSHDILMAIQASTTIDDTKRKKYSSDQFYVKSPSEMYQLFSHVPEAVENTGIIASRCNVTIEFGKNKLPKFDVPYGDNYSYLRELVYLGAKDLYGTVTREIEERIEYELGVVKNMGYLDYFLIVWDFIRYARENGILVGPGRGSGAGSIITYCLYITKIDPLKYGLLFERFLDPSRVSAPDLDIDFQDDRREEVIGYVVQKYGRNSIAQIITFGSMAARSAIRAVGRALDHPYASYDVLAKMVPMEPGIKLKDAIEMVPDLKNRYLMNEHTKYLLDAAMSLEGLPLHAGTHASGVLIVDELGVSAHVPMWRTDKGIVAQFVMGSLEELGLLKFDFLGLSTLTVVAKTIYWVKQNYGIDIDLESLYKCEDLVPLQMIRDGNTDGIFQAEGGGMTQFLIELKPRNIEEIILGISIYRPGPKQYISKLLVNRRNEHNIFYEFAELKPILQMTYGILTYQEQCMQAVVALAGYQKKHSDGFRKAIGKKIANLIQEHRLYFIDGKEGEIPGGVAMGHPRDKLEKFYTEMQEFGKYAFNKCFSGQEKLYRVKTRSASMTIEKMYKIKNDRQYAEERDQLSLHMKYKHLGYGKALSMCEDGRLRPNNIVDIHYSGIMMTYLVTTEDGRTIKCTLNHSFPTPKGKKLLSDLSVGDELYVNTEVEKQVYTKLNTIRHKNSPSKGQCGFQKGGPIGIWFFDEYRQKKVGTKCELCENTGKELHHKDNDKDNNVEENYQWLCVSCHKKEHYKLGRTKVYGKGIPVKTSKIISIEMYEEENVYDVEMEAPNHNVLMMGGIIASNSHGACYAVIAYITCWLKFYYPAEYMASLMDSYNKDKIRVGRYITHCKKVLGIQVIPPDIFNSREVFVPTPNKQIVYSLSAKGAKEENIRKIVYNPAKMSTMYDFFRNNYENLDKTTLEALVAIGAFSSLGIVKSRYLAALEDIADTLTKIKSAKKTAEETPKILKNGKPARKKPFVFEDRFDLDSLLPDIIEFPDEQSLKIEKQFLGLYLSGHPLERYSFSIENFSDFKTSDIDYEIDEATGEVMIIADDVVDGKEVRFVGVLNAIKKIITKKKTLMANLEVEDLFGVCKVTMFPEMYARAESLLKEDEVYQVRGKVSCREGEIPSIICTSLQKLSQIVVKRILILARHDLKQILHHLDLLKVSGHNPIYVIHNGVRMLLPKEHWVDIDLFLLYRDQSIISDDRILIQEW